MRGLGRKRGIARAGVFGGAVITAGLGVGLAWAAMAPAPTVDQTTLGTDKLPPKGLKSLKITKKAFKEQRVVFSVAVPGRVTSETLVALGEYQVSFCTDDDISGGGSPKSKCIGISPYKYTPKVRTRVILAPGPSDTSGTVLSDWKPTDCRKATHHCPVLFNVSFTGGAGGGYVNVIAAADSGGKKRDGDDVLDVERKGKLDVVRIGMNRLGDTKRFADTKRNNKRIPVVPNAPVSKVAFRVKVPDVKKGDVLEVHSKLVVSKPSNYKFNPLVTTQVRAKGLGIVGINGPNCTGTCRIVDVGANRAKKAGTARVELIARAVRNDKAAAGGVVKLRSGALVVLRRRAG